MHGFLDELTTDLTSDLFLDLLSVVFLLLGILNNLHTLGPLNGDRGCGILRDEDVNMLISCCDHGDIGALLTLVGISSFILSFLGTLCCGLSAIGGRCLQRADNFGESVHKVGIFSLCMRVHLRELVIHLRHRLWGIQ